MKLNIMSSKSLESRLYLFNSQVHRNKRIFLKKQAGFEPILFVITKLHRLIRMGTK